MQQQPCTGAMPPCNRPCLLPRLQEVVASLDHQLLPVRGVMAHVTGYPEADKDDLVHRFLAVACPVARALAPARVAVHWADSTEALRMLGPGSRMQLPAGAFVAAGGSGSGLGAHGGGSGGNGAASNIEFWARLGKLCFGADPTVNRKQLQGGAAPVMR